MSQTKKKVHHFTSKFPCCTVLMKSTNVDGYKLRFPRRFCRQIPFNKHGSLLFEGQDGKEWPVKYFDEGYEGTPIIVVSGGWMYFVKDNNLKIGDSCGFEWLPHRSNTTLRVTIFRNSNVDDFDVDGVRTSPPRSNVVSYGSTVKIVEKKKLFKPKTSRFFKIIHQECVDRGTLLIPKKFAREHKNDLPNQVLLKVPSGTVWKVELVQSEDELWLRKGWRAFQKYYSIAHGTFLVFEYTGGSSFDVSIFDTTTSEIDYPYDDYEEPVIWREQNEVSKKRKRDDNASVDESLPSSKRRAKSSFSCPQPPEMGRTTFSSNSKSKLNISNSAKRGSPGISSHKHGENKIRRSTKALQNTRTLKTQEFAVVNSQNNSRGFKEAAGSKSENPSFVIVMRSTYLSGHYVLIPFSFATIHLKQEIGNVILQISKSKIWTVAYKIYSQCRVAQLQSGWSAFVGANKLQLGDECIFELINPAECRLKVVIVRAGNEKVPMLPAPKEKCISRKTKTTIKLKSSAAELQTCVPPAVAQSIRIKIENSS